jgi:Alr-MurF fusion protein
LKYPLDHIAKIIGAPGIRDNSIIEHLLLDSRKVYFPTTSLFFALRGARRDGHGFISELFKKGVRNFVVSVAIDGSSYPGANFLRVDDTLHALQQLASHHRKQFTIPVIGITGSNGKTIVKEWLYQLLYQDHNIVRSPKSFNSQIGVPLSVWQMNKQHTLGIFEAGISMPGEMINLEKIISPSIGILTTVGQAHGEGFMNTAHKFSEKLKLFSHCKVLIGREADFIAQKLLGEHLDGQLAVLTWGHSSQNNFIVNSIEKDDRSTSITLTHQSGAVPFDIPFTDDASIENAITCCCVLLYLGASINVIQERMKLLQPVNMRLELKKGINNCSVINDSYSADLSSLDMALNFLDQQSGGSRKTVILSDFLQSASSDQQLYASIVNSLKKHQVSRLIGIGDRISQGLGPLIQPRDKIAMEFYPSTEIYLQQIRSSQFRDETILVKGARIFGFEKIVQHLEQKVHQTVLEINLNAIVHNLKEYQRQLDPSTKVMAMVKAFAYGSGGAEIAGILQYHKVDYLGVAYADEGVELRKAGILLPVMVMNPEENSFDTIVDNNLEPEIYSLSLLDSFDAFLRKEGIHDYPIHIEIETGMNRLGFALHEIDRLATFLNNTSSFRIQSVFSHLAGSEEASEDAFTMAQSDSFAKAADELQEKTGAEFLRHIANSAAILRHPLLQLDMVRLGIGLYGIDSSDTHKLDLLPVATLKSTVAQVKHVRAGESISYNRKGTVHRDSIIATIRLGYADGYPRRLGNGIGKIFLKGQLAPVIGVVCMDMMMVDVTEIPGVKEGDDVIIFGKDLPVQSLASWAQTIPYEIMTGVSQRVKRVYFEE